MNTPVWPNGRVLDKYHIWSDCDVSYGERERERERKKKKQGPQENLELGLYFHSPSLQTVYDALHELCEMLGLQKEEDLEEFGLYVDPGKRVSRLQ